MPEVSPEQTVPMDVTEEMVASEFEILDEDSSSDISTDNSVLTSDDNNDDNDDSSTEVETKEEA